MNNGLDGDGEFADFGREKTTKNMADKGKFKVTSLRNIALTAPYMHDGRFKTLEEVVEHYNSQIKVSASLDPALEQTRAKGLFLSDQDKKDLVAFLKTLTDESFKPQIPQQVPSGLTPVEHKNSSIVTKASALHANSTPGESS